MRALLALALLLLVSCDTGGSGAGKPAETGTGTSASPSSCGEECTQLTQRREQAAENLKELWLLLRVVKDSKWESKSKELSFARSVSFGRVLEIRKDSFDEEASYAVFIEFNEALVLDHDPDFKKIAETIIK